MDLIPILKALRRNKVGAILIGLQMAITLAVACNCLSVIQQYVASSTSPTGIDEANIFSFTNQWVGNPADVAARIQGDLSAIRQVPGVVDVQNTNSFPLRGGGWGWGLAVKPDKSPVSSTTLYFVDEHGLTTYGLKLVAGRWLGANEVTDHGMHDTSFPPSIVVTADLAHRLYPNGNGLGQLVYWTSTAPSRIVGIVERAQTPWASFGGGDGGSLSTFLPYHFINTATFYVVRAHPGQRASVMKAVQERLYSLSRQRIVDNVRTFAETRSFAYFRARATAVLLGALAALLLGITVFGIIGLTMYWVGQRRRHIGMRRALGARRLDILGYFHTENLIIAGTGVLLGFGLGIASNLWLVSYFEMPRMNAAYIGWGALIILALSQAAVVWPALRAASTSPAIATRGL
jgi:putative ABC transport system permease protein